MDHAITHFSKWRARIWPVQNVELWKFLPLLFIKFCVSFNYTLLHSTKDTVTVTTSGLGAEAIPFLKGAVVITGAFLFTLLYAKLSNKLSRRALFYTTLFPFLAFFASFAFLLFPHREALKPLDDAIILAGSKPAIWLAIYQNWGTALFYVMAELWGSAVIGVLFWGFANEINNLSEAARFYTLYAVGGHLGVLCAGVVIMKLTHFEGPKAYELTLKTLMGCVVVVGLAVAYSYHRLNRQLELRVYAPKKRQHPKSKVKTNLREGLWTVLRSPYLGLIALMVIGYSLSVNLVEVTWKALLRLQFPQASEYQAFMGQISTLIGGLSIILAFFAGGQLIRRIGWLRSALLTPMVLGAISLIFFALLAYFSHAHDLNAMPPLVLTVLVGCGAVHNVLCKTMKYCLFDPTKEMAFIPLDRNTQVKGKAAVEVVASRLGKSGSSWLQIGLIEFLGQGTVLSISNALGPLVLIAILSWWQAVRYLNIRFTKLSVKSSNVA